MTDEPNKDLAPGCYGLGLTFKAESAECGSCPFNTSCEASGIERLARIRAELGITVRSTKQKASAPWPTHPTGTGLTTPKNVEALLTRIEAAGIKVTEAVTAGRNPFPTSKLNFLWLGCQLLLNAHRLAHGLTHAVMKHAFMTKLDLSPQVAETHVYAVFGMFEALGLAQVHNGALRLNRRAGV